MTNELTKFFSMNGVDNGDFWRWVRWLNELEEELAFNGFSTSDLLRVDNGESLLADFANDVKARDVAESFAEDMLN